MAVKKISRGPIQKIEYKDGELLPISVIAKREGISISDLTGEYNKNKDIFEAVKRCKEKVEERKARKMQIEQNEKEEYYGERLRLREIAKREKVDAKELRRCFNITKDVYKAVFMAKFQMMKKKSVKIEGAIVDLYDLSLLIGVKYENLINLLNEGITIKEIKEKYINQDVAKKIKLASGQTLLEFCVEKNLNFAFIYRAICTYRKSLLDAVEACRINDKSIPMHWAYEEYGEEFKKLEINKTQEAAFLYDLRNKKMSLDEAMEGCIVRKKARENNISTEWGEVLYGIIKTRELLEEEFHSEIKINEIERTFLSEAEIELSELKRKMQSNPTQTLQIDDEEQGLYLQ